MLSNLNQCRDEIKKIDFKIFKYLSFFKIAESKQEIKSHFININKIVNDEYNRIVGLEFKIDYSKEIKDTLIHIFENLIFINDLLFEKIYNENEIKISEKIVKYISKRIYIGHYVAESKYKDDLINLHSKKEDEIFEIVTKPNIEKKVIERLKNNSQYNEDKIDFIVNLYKNYIIQYNKEIQSKLIEKKK